MSTVHVNVTFQGIKPESQDEFRKWAEEVASRSREEADTLWYGAFLSQDGTTAVLREGYPSSAAVLDHFGRIQHAVGPMVACAENVTIDLYGDASEELQGALAQFNPGVYSTISEK